MKYTILCALVALLPTSLVAGEQITIHARFIEAERNARIPHTLAKLDEHKSINSVSLPSAQTRSGKEVRMEMVRPFGLPPYGIHERKRTVSAGVILVVTPYLRKGELAYTGTLTIREFTGLEPHGAPTDRKNLLAFTSRELYVSGRPKNGEPVWFEITEPDSLHKRAVCLEFNRKSA